MYLDEIVAAQHRGQGRGIPSICSAHPAVLRQALRALTHPLIEATCNQVNQFGGYTGMKPVDFVAFVRRIAGEAGIPFENILLGGDHLGPHVWQGEPADSAMAKARQMVASYSEAGFTKIHLDCSMRLAGDAPGALDKEVAARRAAELARVAEQSSQAAPRYIIGTEVPRPGGATANEEGMHVTEVDDVCETIEVHRNAFQDIGLEAAWERVIAVVVQPGVEFGDDSVTPYSSEAGHGLSGFIDGQSLVYEAHSTDYQTAEALRNMVRDHFAILKVGPALTFAYREAIFALAMIENEWIPKSARSNLLAVIDEVMLARPNHWNGYYGGTAEELHLKRKFSLSDRIRYYWTDPESENAVNTLMGNLNRRPVPRSLASQFLGRTDLSPSEFIQWKIGRVLEDYAAACGRED
jgi:D-tagatose-1,6-bisphosphate aldolase subunit GatZ/KbaZ